MPGLKLRNPVHLPAGLLKPETGRSRAVGRQKHTESGSFRILKHKGKPESFLNLKRTLAIQ